MTKHPSGDRTPPRRTRIIATLGPATDATGVLDALVAAGLDVARLNASHGTADDHRRRAAAVRRAARKAGREIAILFDLPGPKVRLGELDAPVALEAGERVVLVAGRVADGSPAARRQRLPVAHAQLARDVSPGDPVLLADGAVRLEVLSVLGREVTCVVVDGGTVRSRAGLNLPAARVTTRNPTGRDLVALQVGIELGADAFAQSFVQDAGDVRRLARHVAAGGSDAPVIAKIEKPRAVEDLEAILDVADGVMVARGDLGVECPLEDVPLVQKRIIRGANARGLPVVTATQMLESMILEPRPTRAEASDVANAILDGTDAVMLSAETAAGRHPVESVRVMDAIARRTEGSEAWQLRFASALDSPARLGDVTEAVARAAVTAAMQAQACAIIVHSVSGASAVRVARLRPAQRIIALTPEVATLRRLRLVSGIETLRLRASATTDRMLLSGLSAVARAGLLRRGDVVVVVAGSTPLDAGSNIVKLDSIK